MNNIFTNNRSGYYISSKIFSEDKTPLRTAEKYEIELYTTGTNTSVINSVSYPQSAGNVLIARPNDLRYSIGAFECYYTHFLCDDKEICNALCSLPSVFTPSSFESFKAVFTKIANSSSLEGISKALCVQGCLMELISLLLSENTKKYQGKYERYLPDIFSACDYIKKNFGNHITLSDISAAANLSPGFFHTVFKSVMGQTPAEYLLNLRLDTAKEMLKNSNVPLADIAVLCGFGSQGYFNYVFKNKTNRTPKSYRDKKKIII